MSNAGEVLLVVTLELPPVFRKDTQVSRFTPAAVARLAQLAADPDEGVSTRARLLLHDVRYGHPIETVRQFNTTWDVLHRLERKVLENGPDWLLQFRGKRLKPPGG